MTTFLTDTERPALSEKNREQNKRLENNRR